MKKRFFLTGKYIFILLMLSHIGLALAGPTEKRAALDKAIQWLEQAQNPDGSWGDDESLRYITTSSVVETLKSSGDDGAAYYAGLAWLENHNANNVDALSRKIAALYDRGGNLSEDIALLLAAKKDLSQAGWGLSRNYSGSPFDTGIALQTFFKTGDAAAQNEAVGYLQGSQLAGGGWSLVNLDTSDYWVTANISRALAELPNPASDLTTAINNASLFLESVPLTSSSLVLAQTALALDKAKADAVTIDGLVTELLARQNPVAGDWGDVYTTASVVRTLASLLQLDTSDLLARVEIEDQTLRTILNGQLGHNAFDNIHKGELQGITSLNLIGTDVTSLAGLENDGKLQSLTIGPGISDTSMFTGMNGITLYVDTDGDGVVDYTMADFASDLDGDGVHRYDESLRGTNADLADTLPDTMLRASLVAQLGQGATTGDWQTISVNNVVKHPVVIAGVAGFHDPKPGVVQVTDVGAAGFKLAFENWNYLGTTAHRAEKVSYLALESGHYYLADGSTWEVGTLNVSGTATVARRQFAEAFAETPTVIISTQTNSDADVVTARVTNLSASGFDVTLHEQESLMDGHSTTKVGYVAIYNPAQSGSVTLDGVSHNYSLASLNVSSAYQHVPGAPYYIRLTEEASLDAEQTHVAETVNLLTFDGKNLFAEDISGLEADTSVLRYQDTSILILPAILSTLGN